MIHSTRGVLLFAWSMAAVPLLAQQPFVLVDAASVQHEFGSLQAAIDAVAARRVGGESGDFTLLVRDGVYKLDAPVVIGPDVTTPKSHLKIAAFPGARPVFSGGTRVQWRVGEANGRTEWTAELGVAGKDLRELWIDGARRTLARHPDHGTLAVESVPTADGEWTHGNFGFRCKPGELDPSAVGGDLVVMCRWVESHLPITAFDTATNTITTSKRSVFRLDSGDPWYAEGAAAFLDQPGEFCVDRTTGRLRYLPKPGEDPAKVQAFVPRLAQLLRLAGVPEQGRFVDNVTFEGLAFEHAEWWFPADFRSNWPSPDAGGFAQAAILVPAAISATGARNCTFDGCEIAHVGTYGVELDRGCAGNTFSHCRIHDLGAGGIKLGETAIRKDAGDATAGNLIADCEVGDGGHLFHSAIGVWIGQSPGNQIVHNEIHDFLYSGISIGWTWGYGEALARDELIEGNHVHHIGVRQDGEGVWLADMAGIYTLGRQPGTVIRGNWFHDIAAFKYGGWGIYFDEGTSDVRAEGNVVARTTHGGFHQHYGKDNVFANNVLIAGRDAQIQRTRPEEHTSFTFTKNIVVWPQGKLFAGDLQNLHYAFDNNIYWRTDGEPIRFGDWLFADWQGKGMDRSSRIVDPQFVDAAHDDYRLTADSPARALGIESNDLRAVGPRLRR